MACHAFELTSKYEYLVFSVALTQNVNIRLDIFYRNKLIFVYNNWDTIRDEFVQHNK